MPTLNSKNVKFQLDLGNGVVRDVQPFEAETLLEESVVALRALRRALQGAHASCESFESNAAKFVYAALLPVLHAAINEIEKERRK